jgi:hypothetical protein
MSFVVKKILKKKKNLLDFQLRPLYNVYQTIKITIIKPKTKITMKPNSIKSKVRRRRTICNLTSDICLELFSKELFSNTRLSQLSTGGVQLHIEDCQAGVQRSSREKKLLKMRNKPNFQKSRQTVTLDMISTYNEKKLLPTKKNKPKTHQKRTKNEQKRTKTNQNEPNSTPKTTPPNHSQFPGFFHFLGFYGIVPS